jgi:ABC-type glycerol-3-phosphate transport system substrate-binding protein
LGGRILTIFEQSSHQAEAWQFLRYLFEPSVQVQLYQAALDTQDAYLPPNRATWAQLPMAASMKAVLEEQAEDAKGPPAVPGWEDATQLIETALQRIILHDAPVPVELAEAVRGMNRAVKHAREQE